VQQILGALLGNPTNCFLDLAVEAMPTRDPIIRSPLVADAASPHPHLRSSSRRRSSSSRQKS
jgi:hypothetical protein